MVVVMNKPILLFSITKTPKDSREESKKKDETASTRIVRKKKTYAPNYSPIKNSLYQTDFFIRPHSVILMVVNKKPQCLLDNGRIKLFAVQSPTLFVLIHNPTSRSVYVKKNSSLEDILQLRHVHHIIYDRRPMKKDLKCDES